MTDMTTMVSVLETQNQILSKIADCICKLEECVCAGSNSSVRMQLQWVMGAIVIDGTAWFCFDPPYNGTINAMTYFTGSDSFDVDVAIGGTPVTGLSVTVGSATPTTANASAANNFVVGQPITLEVSGTTGSPTDTLLSLNVVWTN